MKNKLIAACCNGIFRIHLRRLLLACVLLVGALNAPVFAAGTTVINTDRNHRIAMIDSLADGKSTRLFFVTYPEVTQAHVREECTANYYLLDLQPGLANPQPKLLAENYCGHALDRSGALLANGDAAIISADRFEIWRPGVGRVSGWSLSGVQSLQSSARSFTAGGINVGVSPNGNLVVAAAMPRPKPPLQNLRPWRAFDARRYGKHADARRIETATAPAQSGH